MGTMTDNPPHAFVRSLDNMVQSNNDPSSSSSATADTSEVQRPVNVLTWQHVWHLLRRTTPRTFLRTMLILVALTTLAGLFWHAWAALLPFQVGVIIAYLTLPVVNRLEQYIPRWSAIVLVFIAIVAAFLIAVAYIVPPLIDQSTAVLAALPHMEDIQREADRALNTLESYLESLPPGAREQVDAAIESGVNTVRDNLIAYVERIIAFLISSTLSLINTFTFMLGFLIVPFWVFYVMHDQRKGLLALNKLLPDWLRTDFWAVLTIIDRVFSSYIRGQLFLGFVVAIAVYVGLTILETLGVQGIQYKLLLAVIAGFCELIPFIGPILGAIPAVGVGLFSSWQTTLAIIVLFVIIQQVENNFLVPRVIGRSVGIHPSILLVVIIVLGQLGLIWILLAAPLAAVLRDTFRYIHGRLQEPPRPAGLLPVGVARKETVQPTTPLPRERHRDAEPTFDEQGVPSERSISQQTSDAQ